MQDVNGGEVNREHSCSAQGRARRCSLAPGSFGDVIGVPGNPIDDLNLLAKPDNVKLVLKGGALVKKLD